jgi:hypothetical protein
MIKRIYLVFALFVIPFIVFSQEQEEDETKMVREVVSVMVDKAKFAAPTPPPQPVAEQHGKKKHKKQQEEVAPPPAADTGATTIPAPSEELAKRANNWLKAKTTKYVKANGSNSGNTISCNATFVYKQKILNPENDVDGKITMDVIVDAKEGKYRYTIKNIKHISDKPGLSGGSIYEKVPECGSMKMSDLTWKHVKSAAYADIQMVVDDLKAQMKLDGDQKKKDDW